MLQAWNSIKNNDEIQNKKLVIMGVDFGFEVEMQQMINKLEIKDSVIVIKKPPREDVLAAYSTCQFLALPSRWELSPLTPLEGFAFKKTTISTTAHGIPHTLKNGENAILVEPGNHIQLAEAILELLKDKKKRNDYGNAGYNLVEQVCNSKSMTENTLKIYQQVRTDS